MAVVRPLAAASDDADRADWIRVALRAAVPAVALSVAIGVPLAVSADASWLAMTYLVLGLSADAMYFQILTGRRRYMTATVYRLVANVAQLAITVALLVAGVRSVHVFLGVFGGSYVLGMAAVELRGAGVLPMLRLPSAHAVSARLRRLLAASVPSALTGYAYAALAGLDTYFLVLNRRDMVATYGAAKTLSVPPLLVAYALGNMVQSEAAHATPEDAAALRRRILRGGLLVAAAGTGVACAVAAPAVHLLYGHRFPQAPGALRLLAAATALLGLHSLLHTWAFGRGKYHYPLISLSLGILPAVGLNLALVPAIGITGAAAGVLAGTVVAVGALWLLTGRLAAVGADQPALAAGDVPATAAYDGARTSRAATRDPARRS